MLKKIFDRWFAVESDIKANELDYNVCSSEIIMYSTRFCPYCMRARMLLERKGLDFRDIAVDGNPALRREMLEKSKRNTVPQIWIGKHHIGGCDELYQLEHQGELDTLLLELSYE